MLSRIGRTVGGTVLVTLCLALACGGGSSAKNPGDAASSDGESPSEAAAPDDSGGTTCSGSAPTCCVAVPGAGCECPRDPPFRVATCVAGAWTCGAGYELESSCPVDSGSNPDTGSGKPCLDEGGGVSPPPECYGTDITKCCSSKEAQPANCVDGRWMCGSSPFQGCNGTFCKDDGGGPG